MLLDVHEVEEGFDVLLETFDDVEVLADVLVDVLEAEEDGVLLDVLQDVIVVLAAQPRLHGL